MRKVIGIIAAITMAVTISACGNSSAVKRKSNYPSNGINNQQPIYNTNERINLDNKYRNTAGGNVPGLDN